MTCDGCGCVVEVGTGIVHRLLSRRYEVVVCSYVCALGVAHKRASAGRGGGEVTPPGGAEYHRAILALEAERAAGCPE